MSLIFAALTPHPPLLIPAISKDNLSQIDKTVKAMQTLEMDLYAGKPDTIIVISPHGQVIADAFTFNLADSYESDLAQFGDLTTKLRFRGNPPLIDRLRGACHEENNATVITEEKIDHGVTVPLFYLAQHLPEVKIVPIGYSLQDYASQLHFGEKIKDVIFDTNERIAIIASGDLSHRLAQNSPAGYSAQGKEFDEKLAQLIKDKDIDGIVNLNRNLIEEAGECGLRSLLVLLGVIQKINYQPEILSYEGPFGVGYMVCNFRIK